MIGVYIRISSYSQKADSQRAEIERWLTSHGHNLANVLWFEDTETGKTLDRPAFKKLQAAIFDGKVKTVVVWKLDQLARGLKDGINILREMLFRGIYQYSIKPQCISGHVRRTP